MAKKIPHVNIHDALQLNGDAETILKHYSKWSETYDEDVIENYYGINYICKLLDNHLKQQTTLHDPGQIQLADVGCGTGLQGRVLQQLGYSHLDGIDFSPAMLEKARQTGFYKQLYADFDLNQPAPEYLRAKYDAVLCLGTFTPGHVQPEALFQLIEITKSNGLVVLSTRIPYYDTTDFRRVSDQVVSENRARLIEQRMNAPYRDDGDAHYWVYEVL